MITTETNFSEMEKKMDNIRENTQGLINSDLLLETDNVKRDEWGNPTGPICTKCNKNKLYNVDVMNSLSRQDNETYICSDCGEMEAFEDWK